MTMDARGREHMYSTVCHCADCEAQRRGLPKVLPDVVLSVAERDLLRALRSVDFYRIGRERAAIVRWTGNRLIVLDAQQVSA